MKRKTIIISDLHLASPDAEYEKLLKFLKINTGEKIILNGDIIDYRYIRYFGSRKNTHKKALTKITEICKKNKSKMIYLCGNHEKGIPAPQDIHSSRKKTQKEITITSNKKKYIICHGDNFETGANKPNLLTIGLFFIGTFFLRIDRVLHSKFAVSFFLKKIYALLTNQKKRFLKKAINYAQKKKVEGIICGHTHIPANKKIGNIHYLNSGDWREHCTALVEDFDGNRKILKYKE